MLQTAILIYEEVELLDFAGPGEVFQVTRKDQKPAFKVYTVSASPATVTCQEFLHIQPQHTFETAPQADILLIPGGSTTRVTDDPKAMDWIRKAAGGAKIVISVCTGAFILAEAGLLDHKKATTWHRAIDQLRKKAPLTEIVEQTRLVDNGKIITTAGVSAGIDGALHIVSRLLGKETAAETARYIEYEDSTYSCFS